MSDIRTQILLVMAGAPKGTELAAAYAGVAAGKWELEDVEEFRVSPAALRTEIGKLKRRLSRPRGM